MIFDKLDNIDIYEGINENFKIAFDYLKNIELSKLNTGVHKIDGDKVFAIVSEYETKNINDGLWEGHRKYIDIQYVARGKERIGISHIDSAEITQEYNQEADVLLGNSEGQYIDVNQGEFMILFPTDFHKPGVRKDEKENVTKIVVKVEI